MMKILVVDDERELCLLLQQMLVRMGHDVTTATNLTEAQNIISENQFDAAFLDLYLPDGNGLGLIPFLKKKFLNIKLVINSAYDGEYEKGKAREAGAHYFMSKPFNRKMLNEALKYINL